MKNTHPFRRMALALIFLALYSAASAVEATYYSSIDGKAGKDLFDAIHTVAKSGYTSLSYDSLWTAYEETDLNSAGKIWDMYGGCTFTYKSDQCGNYTNECDCYNREHSIPKSWFGGSEGANTPGSDIFHIVPTDGKVNGMRSNYAFGEVSSATYSYNDSKLGSPQSISVENTIAGSNVTANCSSSPVFEPIDEYKGDFARGYMGTMVRWANSDYQTFTTGDGATIFSTDYTAAQYFGLTKYGVALLMKWHREDPVSQKELDRNNAVQNVQGNRNPFIDYPCLAEYLWGDKAGEKVDLNKLISAYSVEYNSTNQGCPCAVDNDDDATFVAVGKPIVIENVKQNDITCTGTSVLQLRITNLAGNVAVASSNQNVFTVAPAVVTPAEAAAGVTLTITKVAAGAADLTITGGVVDQTIGVTCE